ncbi:hypothetical protein NDU88_009335 [Pleurodeles waltl]|uniref:Uncharacterized protein n=1 Tax=Pleurodeles waltl TaxID=8319 RepID=A0AAV7P0E2_PLEWA|nr:hypothetical protein NDU88_009335 [Pleurodeles waltl]
MMVVTLTEDRDIPRGQHSAARGLRRRGKGLHPLTRPSAGSGRGCVGPQRGAESVRQPLPNYRYNPSPVGHEALEAILARAATGACGNRISMPRQKHHNREMEGDSPTSPLTSKRGPQGKKKGSGEGARQSDNP